MSDKGSEGGGGFFNDKTRRVGSGAGERNAGLDATRKLGGQDREPPAAASVPAAESVREDVTRRAQPRQRPASGDAATEHAVEVPQSGPEYVVGWLVVVDGPGRGRSAPLGYGLNAIGRDPDNLVVLNFGDEQISRHGHCAIAYDHKNNRFFVQHGGGQNLTYLGDEPVLASQPLPSDSMITIGATTLRFVQFCDDRFTWDVEE
ncbi:MAG: FHA domain-containing protein [Pseudomonadota bacterium]